MDAAKLLDLDTVPTICLAHLNEIERRAYLIAGNKIALNASWDQDLLAGEMQALIDHGIDIEDTGFTIAETDILLEEADNAAPVSKKKAEAADRIPDVAAVAVTRLGDVWQLARHRLVCGDARDGHAYAALLNDEEVDLVFTDPPHNVKIDRNVSGKGAVTHRELAFTSVLRYAEVASAWMAGAGGWTMSSSSGSELRAGLGRWITYYHTQHPHSGLAGRTPVEAYQRIGRSDHGGHAPHDLMIKQVA